MQLEREELIFPTPFSSTRLREICHCFLGLKTKFYGAASELCVFPAAQDVPRLLPHVAAGVKSPIISLSPTAAARSSLWRGSIWPFSLL